MNADWGIVRMDALITFPLCPLTTLRAIAYEETADRGGIEIWGTGRRIKVERNLDPNIAWTGNVRVWRLRRVELKPA